MAKNLLLGILLENAGLYIEEESLASDNLKIGVLSGQVKLTNLKIKKHALRAITGQPILVEKGYVSTISVEIPWTQLGSSPVKINIDGVYMQASVMDGNTTPLDILKAMEAALKGSKLQRAEDMAYTAGVNANKDSKETEQSKSSYFQQLAGKIVDNLEIRFTNVHIRYEDMITTPGNSFCGGLLLKSFILQATDDKWNPQFIERDKKKGGKQSSIYKLGQITNLGIYWRPAEGSADSLLYEDWLANMTAPFTDRSSIKDYEILPFENLLSLRMTINETHDKIVPKFDMILLSSGFNFRISRLQFQQISAAAQTLSVFERIKQIRLQRPSESAKENPRAWWQYARWRLTGRLSSYEHQKHFEAIISGQKLKKQYVKCVKEVRTLSTSDRTNAVYLRALESRNKIEEELPLSTLIYFRQFAMTELANEEAKAAKETKKSAGWGLKIAGSKDDLLKGQGSSAEASSQGGSIYGYIKRGFKPKQASTSSSSSGSGDLVSGSSLSEGVVQVQPAKRVSSGASDSTDIDLDDIQHALVKDIEGDVSYLANCRVDGLIVSLEVGSELGAIAAFKLKLSATCEARSDCTTFQFSIDKFSIQDRCTPNPIFPVILSGLSPTEPASLALTAQLEGKKTSVTVKSRPLQLNWNEVCFRALLRFLIAPSDSTSDIILLLYPTVKLKSNAKASEVSFTTELSVQVEINAPILVFPQISTENKPNFVVFDMGFLSLQLSIVGPKFNILTEISHVRAGVSFSSEKVLDIEGESSKIIQPFDVSVVVADPTFPKMRDTTVEVASKAVHLNLSAAKIENLWRAYVSVMNCIMGALQGGKKSKPPHRSVGLVKQSSVLGSNRPTPLLSQRSEKLAGFSSSVPQSSNSSVPMSITSAATSALNVTILLPEVSLDVLYDHVEEGWLHIGCKGFSVAATQALVEISLNAISVQDYAGTTRLASIVEGFHEEKGDLVLVSYVYATSRCEVHVGIIEIGVSEAVILHLIPLVSHTFQVFSQVTLTTASDTTTTPSASGDRQVVVPSAAFNLQRLTLNIDRASSTNALIYEHAYSFSLFGFSIDSDGTSITISLISLSGLDMRAEARDNAHKTLVQASKQASKLKAGATSRIVSRVVKVHVVVSKGPNVTFQTIVVKLKGLDIYVNAALYEDLIQCILSITGAVTQLVDSIDVATSVSKTMKSPNLTVAAGRGKGEEESLSVGAQSGQSSPVGVVRRARSESNPPSQRIEVKLVAPRLILIKDASQAASPALCITADITLDYSRRPSVNGQDMIESSAATVSKMESFLLLNFSAFLRDEVHDDRVLQVVYPFNIAATCRRTFAQDKCLSTEAEFSGEDISVQVTLKDLFLMVDILKRCVIMSRTAVPPSTTGSEDTVVEERSVNNATVSKSTEQPQQQQLRTLTSYSLQSHRLSLVLVILNDCQDQVHPMLQLSFATTSALLSGSSLAMEGSCDADLTVNFYSSQLHVWEPIIEPCTASLRVSVDSDEHRHVVCRLEMDALQVNLSSVMLRAINEVAIKLKEHQRNQLASHERHQLLFHNALGELVDVYDGSSGALLLRNVAGNESIALPFVTQERSRPSHPGLLSIVLTQRSTDFRINHVVVSSATSLRSYRAVESLKMTHEATNSVKIVITEEIYENQRYGLQGRKWIAPFIVSDPAEWTDIHGQEVPDIRTFPLIHEGWKWVTPWEVHFDVNDNVRDAQGFEYDVNFPSFELNHTAKRGRQPLDAVRRRKWVRTRQLINDNVGSFVGTYVFASLKYDLNGAQVFKVESNFKIVNHTSLLLLFKISNKNEQDSHELEFSINGEGEASVPLAYTSPKYVKFCFGAKVWTHAYKLSEFEKPQYVELFSASDRRVRFVRVSVLEGTGGHTQLICAPCCTITNHVLFDIRTRLTLSGHVEEHSIPAGGSVSVYEADIRDSCEVSFSMAGFKWGTLPAQGTSVELSPDTGGGISSATLAVASKYDAFGTLIFTARSRAVLVNYCDTPIYLRSAGTVVSVATSHPYEEHAKGGTEQDTQHQLQLSGGKLGDWVSGEAGVRLINLNDSDTFQLGIRCSNGNSSVSPSLDSWSEALSLGGVMENTKTPFEISTPDTKFQVACLVSPLDGVFFETKQITLMPKFRVLNSLSCTVELKLVNTDKAVDLAPGKFSSWSPSGSGKSTSVVVKTESSEWSVGAIDLNVIGSFDLLLPPSTSAHIGGNNASDVEIEPEVVHIEIMLAPASDLTAYISVVIWAPSELLRYTKNHGTAIRIQNTTDACFTLIQTSPKIERLNHDLEVKCKLKVLPRSSRAYGWIDPRADNTVKVSLSDVSTTSPALSSLFAVVNMHDIGSAVDLEYNAQCGSFRLLVLNEKDGKVLKITPAEDAEDTRDNGAVAAADTFCFALSLDQLGISLIAERPTRREILAVTLTRITAEYWDRHHAISYLIKLVDAQVDNYFENNAYPVLFIADRSKHSDVVAALPLLEVFIEAEPVSKHLVYRSFLVRLLEVKLSVDSSSLQLYILDFFNDTEASSDTIRRRTEEDRIVWVGKYRTSILTEGQLGALDDRERILYEAQVKEKVYIENIVIHPIKVTLNFTTTHMVRRKSPLHDVVTPAGTSGNSGSDGLDDNKYMRIVKSMGSFTAVNDMVVKINSFIACNVLETQDALIQLLLVKITRDLQGQLLHLAGSYFGKLDAIGRPADLFSHIGGGVSDFFYEPYQGLMKSPKDFAKGLGKGTKSLISGLVGGTLTSTMTIVETASLGAAKSASLLSEITGDSAMAKKREEARKKNEASSKGVMGGFITGGTSVVYGIGSGITGLVTKPIEGAKKGGALGFVKGVGHGVIGVAVNPIVGVTDGLAAVAHGVSTQVSQEVKLQQLRRARVFKKVRREGDRSDSYQLIPMSNQILLADRAITRRSISLDDAVIACEQISEERSLVISTLAVSLHSTGHHSKGEKVDESYPFSIISHFHRNVSKPEVVYLFLFAEERDKTLYKLVPIVCESADRAAALCNELLKEAERMRNPSACYEY